VDSGPVDAEVIDPLPQPANHLIMAGRFAVHPQELSATNKLPLSKKGTVMKEQKLPNNQLLLPVTRKTALTIT